MHKLQSVQFTSLTSESWESLPDMERLRQQIVLAVLAHSELTGESLGLYSPPKEIRQVLITNAAHDQIRVMWHGHRQRGHKAPPAIPLKIFVFGGGQADGTTWSNIEIHPGLDSWDIAE